MMHATLFFLHELSYKNINAFLINSKTNAFLINSKTDAL